VIFYGVSRLFVEPAGILFISVCVCLESYGILTRFVSKPVLRFKARQRQEIAVIAESYQPLPAASH